jgi:nucleoside-diphosphate-sugar epimerase
MTHVILGATGQIGTELAKWLHKDHGNRIRLVSRSPSRVNDADELFSADLLDANQALRAVEGATIVYLTAGLPMDTQRWVEQWPILMNNVMNACKTHGAKLVFFDNTYMYPQTDATQTEETAFQPHGEKGRVRAQIASTLSAAMRQNEIEALICRAPEFYGPGKTQSITNTTIIEKLKAGKVPMVFLRNDTKRTLIYTPDASRAMALLGNTADAFGQTWHLPCDDNRPTYCQFVELAAHEFATAPQHRIVKTWQLRLFGLINPQVRDASELLPRYRQDNIFSSEKFKARFPAFKVTRIPEGLATIATEWRAQKK